NLDAESIKPPRISEISGYINHAALRLYRLIENYLLYMQLELVSHDREQQRILKSGITANPSNAITDQAHHWVLNPHAPSRSREADLILEIGESKSIAIGEEYLNKIVEELIDNACKFSAPDTPIKVEGKQTDQGYNFSVSDQGIGMTAEQIDTIDAYIQFDRNRMEQQGTGLGLAICRLLAELHGGTFTVVSEPEAGTTVKIFLPHAPKA
ncbi:MAG: sensor histidine kinase, partial [Anaerolineae bacterium]|nr:sensor histidine kinase [Anaerolineae bacterium]